MQEISLTNTSEHDVCTYDILVEEKAISAEYQVMSISVLKEVNRIPMATLVLRDGEAAKRDFEISSREDFIPGKKIRIKIGRDSKNNQVFKGIIVRHAIRVRNNGQSELHLDCYDESVRMTIGRHSRYYEEIRDNELIDDLGRRYSGVTTRVSKTKLKHRELVQHHLSDWDFLLLRAEANGMLVIVKDGEINVSPPDTSGKPALQCTYGDSVIELEAEMDSRYQWKQVNGHSWDFANQQLFEANASNPSVEEPGNINGDKLSDVASPKEYLLHHSGHVIQQELQDWVDATLMRSRLAKIRGRIKFTGVSSLVPGSLVQLDGVGNRFKGKVFVSSVRHDIGNGSWDTHVQIGLDPERFAEKYPDMSDAEAAGLIGCIRGLQIGKVVQLQGDPDGQHRILVRIPVIDKKARGTWMRVASLDAGKDRGAFFRPEIDDEVIVGFINDDPRDAVILGMLHSSAKAAPIETKDVNHEKGFTTRSKMHLYFNDDKKKISLDTPAGNSVLLDESGKTIKIKDQNSNSITMSPSGIKIESQKNIDIDAQVNLTLKAGASLKIGGVTISISADGNVSVEGAMAKLSGNGMAEISAAMVKIN